MFRKVLVLIFSSFASLYLTSYTITSIKFEGIKWFIPDKPDILLVCGDHWGGLPFSVVYTTINKEPNDSSLISTHWLCPNKFSTIGAGLNLIFWAFVTYVGIESGIAKLKR